MSGKSEKLISLLMLCVKLDTKGMLDPSRHVTVKEAQRNLTRFIEDLEQGQIDLWNAVENLKKICDDQHLERYGKGIGKGRLT